MDLDKIFEVVKKWFEDDGWPVFDLKGRTLGVRFKGNSGQWTCMVSLSDGGVFRFFSYHPTKGPTRVQNLAYAVALCNQGLFVGNFELDTVEGEVRYKTSLSVKELDEEALKIVIRDLTYVNVTVMDQYYPAISMVASSDIDVQTVIAAAEGKQTARLVGVESVIPEEVGEGES